MFGHPNKNIGGSLDDIYDIELASAQITWPLFRIENKTGNTRMTHMIQKKNNDTYKSTHTNTLVHYHDHHLRSTAQACHHHLEMMCSLLKALDKDNCLVRTGC
jgi:hypothetical protein